MKEDDKPQEESNRFDRNRLGFSDPTPALPEGVGARFETNESFTANEADSLPTKENLSEVNKPVTSSESDSLPLGRAGVGSKNPDTLQQIPILILL